MASILGDKYGVRVEIGGDTAMTDGNTIYLPNLPQKNSNDFIWLLRAYLDHESAHIRYSDFALIAKAKLTPFEKFVWNCIEDWRVEKLMGQHFTGCKANFHWLIRYVFYKDKKKMVNLKEGLADWLLLTIRSWDVAELDKQCKHLEKQIYAECPQLLTELGLLLCEVEEKCHSAKDALHYAKSIVDCIKKTLQNRIQEEEDEHGKQEPSENTNGDANGNIPTENKDQVLTSTNNSQNSTNSSQEGNDDKDEDNHGEDNSGESTTTSRSLSVPKSSEKAGENNIYTSLHNLLNGDDASLPNNTAEIARTIIEKTQSKNKAKSINVAQVGRKLRSDLDPKTVQQTLRLSVALKARLQGLLQAQSLTRRQNASVGKINTQKLHALAVHDSRIFLRNTQTKATNTAIHILLDASASMQGKMFTANKACFALASALESTKGINVGVTVFPALSSSGKKSAKSDQKHVNKDAIYVFPLLKHGEKINHAFDISAEGSTPLTEALWWVLPKLLSQKEDRKIILIITDGEPNDRSTALHAVEEAQKLGVEVYAINIPPLSINILPDNKTITLNNLGQLPQAMFGLLQSALLKPVR